jgi:predicted MPP superfamily phosphohydrolase
MHIMRLLFASAVFLTFVASQIFWLRQIGAATARLIPRRSARRWLAALGLAVYLLLFVYNFGWFARSPEPTTLTPGVALLRAPYLWWLVSSLSGFLAIAGLYFLDHFGRAAYATLASLFFPSNPGPQLLTSPARRRFLKRVTLAAGSTPFVASAYGILYERLEIETTHQRIDLCRLPKAFDGFRVAQLSDIHIGPFLTSAEVRKCAAMVNQLKPDLVALTGDFITWDRSTEGPVVEALSGLKAPYGIFGCLGNHEHWAHAEDSITKLFAAQGVKILRQERAVIESGGERLNLIGVDYQTRSRFGPPDGGIVPRYLEGVDALMLPDTANILFSHNPNTFDRAAELGIDLSLAGHTHGGQITLEFISPDLSPGRLITPYVRGWFQQGQSQLYVNRGIGTIAVPVRFGSLPEITLYELKRA